MSENSEENEITWEASEYIHHEKSPLWYVFFAIGTAAILALTYLLIKDIVSIVIVSMMAITVVIFANRQPRSLKYVLSDNGLKVMGREYGYGSFKSFSVMNYGAVESVYLEPIERFMPPISIYFAPDDADSIIGMLGQYLPHRDKQPDLIDQLVHRIRL